MTCNIWQCLGADFRGTNEPCVTRRHVANTVDLSVWQRRCGQLLPLPLQEQLVIRPHCMHVGPSAQMWPIATNVAWSVCLCVCVPCVYWTQLWAVRDAVRHIDLGGPKEHCLVGPGSPERNGGILGKGIARPNVKYWNICREPKLFATSGSSDAARCDQYCDNLLLLLLRYCC